MEYFEGDNIGSIQAVEIAYHFDFTLFNPAEFAAGKNWIRIPVKEQKGSLFLSGKDSQHGPVFGYSGNFFLPRIRAEVKNELYPFIGKHAILRVTDMNNEVYIIGSPGAPVTLEMSGGTGAAVTDENGQEFQFKNEQAHPAFAL